MSNGFNSGDSADKTLGDAVADVSLKASQLVREEIDLAKAEVTEKVGKLAKGAAIGGAAGVFAIFGITMLFHTLAWLLADVLDTVWLGYLIVTVALFIFAAIAGFVAFKLVKKGAPPTPDLAIEEAKRTRAALEQQKVERDQVGRSLDREDKEQVSA
jgi:uncharacterized membrane protein YqjE